MQSETLLQLCDHDGYVSYDIPEKYNEEILRLLQISKNLNAGLTWGWPTTPAFIKDILGEYYKKTARVVNMKAGPDMIFDTRNLNPHHYHYGYFICQKIHRKGSILITSVDEKFSHCDIKYKE